MKEYVELRMAIYHFAEVDIITYSNENEKDNNTEDDDNWFGN